MRGAFIVAFVTAALAPSPVAAQTDAAEARRYFDAGVEHFQAGRFTEALDAFRDAYRVRPHPSVLVNMANCYLELDRPVEASQHFERYLREAEDIDPERRAEVERALGQARAAVATVRVTGPPGSTVFVDGEAVGRTPLVRPVEVNPGPHIVEMRHPDGSVQEERVEVGRGGEATVQGRSSGAPLAAPSPEPAPTPSPVPAPAPSPPPSDTGGGVPLGTWIAGGIAIAALATGIGFGATALSQQSEFDAIVAEIRALPPDDPRAEDLRAEGEAVADAQSANALVADLMFAGAAVAAGLAVVLLLTSDDGAAETEIAVGPGAVSVRAAF